MGYRGLLHALRALLMPWRNALQLAGLGNFKNFQFPPDYYNGLAALFFNTNDDAIRNLFTSGTKNVFHMSTLFVFFTAILAGATYMQAHSGDPSCGLISDHDPGLFALLGATSFLDRRNNEDDCVSRRRESGEYRSGVEDHRPQWGSSGRRATSIRGSRFQNSLGLCLDPHLLVMLKGKGFMKEKVKTSGSSVLQRFGAFEFAKRGSGKGLKIENLDFSDEEMDMYVDLHPITNTSPYTVVETMALAKAAVLFCALGLKAPARCAKDPRGELSLFESFSRDQILQCWPFF
ncbi:Chloride channel protein CLC-c [Zea mays]|uniref:Chloride channel protein CLC-c n=2 Tax=Zea mays TaxID=4577 RepID=A0A1D6E9X1_MAIZE|nr:Chloride channel protein CLC-c [Zea mays]